jgi:hypothetical protein
MHSSLNIKDDTSMFSSFTFFDIIFLEISIGEFLLLSQWETEMLLNLKGRDDGV